MVGNFNVSSIGILSLCVGNKVMIHKSVPSLIHLKLSVYNIDKRYFNLTFIEAFVKTNKTSVIPARSCLSVNPSIVTEPKQKLLLQSFYFLLYLGFILLFAFKRIYI